MTRVGSQRHRKKNAFFYVVIDITTIKTALFSAVIWLAKMEG
jgi:hypothetical protein